MKPSSLFKKFARSYYIDYEEFKKLLSSTNSFVVGSAALYLYLKQNNVEVDYTPNDMNIFVSLSFGKSENYFKLFDFFKENGYEIDEIKTDKDHQEFNCKYPKIGYDPNLSRIITLTNGNKRVQIVEVNGDVEDYISNHFDLSPCMVWWNTKTEAFTSLYPALTLHKKMVVSSTHKRIKSRIQKYVNRGFELISLE